MSSAAPTPPAAFDAPWQLRTYVMATALLEQQLLDRTDLTQPPDDLRPWVEAVERALLDGGHVSPEELDAEVARQLAVAAARTVH